MACRVGITTNPDARRGYWESQYRNLQNWQILAGPLQDRDEAQRIETAYAQKHGCEAHPGGDEPGSFMAEWYVYYFEHDGKK